MVIGQFNDSFPPVMDGVARVCINYASELVKLGHRCVVVTPKNPQTQGEFPFELMRFKSFSAPRRNEYRWGLGTLDRTFWKEVRQVPFDILHTHCPFSTHLVAKSLARRRGIPLISTFHSKYRDDFRQALKSHLLAEGVVKYIVSAYEKVDEVWTVNEASVETLRSYGYAGEVYIVENGCDIQPALPTPALAQSVRQRFSLPDAPLLLYIGQHTLQKNMPMLLDALGLLRASGAKFAMLFVGDGPLRADMQKQVQQQGLSDCVAFAGIQRDRALIRDIYLASELMLFPSLYDTSSLVPREAAACHCPTLFVRGSSTAQGIVDGQQGFLAEGDAPAFARRLQELLGDKALRQRVAQAAREQLYRPWSAAVQKAQERYAYWVERNKKS